MNVRRKLLVLVAFVAVVPLAVSAYQSLQIHQTALERAHNELHATSAKFAATFVNDRLTATTSTLRTLARDSVNWPNLTGEERDGALWLIYAQLQSSVVVSLLDSQGQGLGPSAYMGETSTEYPDRRPLPPAGLSDFADHIPHQQALRRGEVVGNPFASGDLLILPVAIRISGSAGERWVLAAGIALNDLCAELGELGGPATGRRLTLFDTGHHVLCEFGNATRLSESPPALREILAKSGGSFRYERAGPSGALELLAATAPTFGGYKIVAAQPTDEVQAASSRIRAQALIWLGVGALAALLGGWVLAQSIARPLQELTFGARKIAAGELEFQLSSTENDEFGELAQTFDVMVTEIRKRDQEIRVWNEQLQKRVEERTQELKTATAALLESRTIAAMASLGAGVAHEINNPLTGVLGMTQILLARSRKGTSSGDIALLESVEREALRIGQLVKKMAQLTESAGEDGPVEVSGRQLLLAAVTAERKRMEQCKVLVVEKFAEPKAMVLGNPYQLTELFQRIVDNAVKAMSERGGQLTVEAKKSGDEWIEFLITDTGRGIRSEHLNKVFEPFFTTKDAWQGEGLGLTLAYRIVEAHGGKIEVLSEWQQGTSVRVRLPAARLGSHLV